MRRRRRDPVVMTGGKAANTNFVRKAKWGHHARKGKKSIVIVIGRDPSLSSNRRMMLLYRRAGLQRLDAGSGGWRSQAEDRISKALQRGALTAQESQQLRRWLDSQEVGRDPNRKTSMRSYRKKYSKARFKGKLECGECGRANFFTTRGLHKHVWKAHKRKTARTSKRAGGLLASFMKPAKRPEQSPGRTKTSVGTGSKKVFIVTHFDGPNMSGESHFGDVCLAANAKAAEACFPRFKKDFAQRRAIMKQISPSVLTSSAKHKLGITSREHHMRNAHGVQAYASPGRTKVSVGKITIKKHPGLHAWDVYVGSEYLGPIEANSASEARRLAPRMIAEDRRLAAFKPGELRERTRRRKLGLADRDWPGHYRAHRKAALKGWRRRRGRARHRRDC